MELAEKTALVLDNWAKVATRETETINLLQSVYFDLFGTYVQRDCGSCYQKAFIRIQKFVYLNNQENLEQKTEAQTVETESLTLNNYTMAKALKDRKYLLKDGVVLQDGFGGEYLSNDNLTDDKAAKLLKKYPNLAANFERIPADTADDTADDTSADDAGTKPKTKNKAGRKKGSKKRTAPADADVTPTTADAPAGDANTDPNTGDSNGAES